MTSLEVRDRLVEKLTFHHRVGVDELIIADPDTRTIRILVRDAAEYREVDRSALLGTVRSSLEASIDWPA